ncbi:SDR family NAD(P)-dependent oxidoreductase [Streptomyces dengpaensis]|uniref:SDR family NAD(P)-dependent oxidoreductase n=2 Tax=Streptomyces TaxID=1883 RepID=A0ABN5HVJ2_9ACTN|nr:SDR family oxidoreductase [Streptomyces dengpaensis]AVH54944.1 SDR family NAD(P)-dependent oxidoreductase [Streptomyces dengpaensis]PIB08242.1 short-chain dehydrogenase [Streptomyces sp. HG99]
MLLADKNAVIYGAGGAIGGAVARAFAREGARVFLAGRTRATLEAVAAEISAAGGTAATAQVDALDEQSVNECVAGIVKEAGRVDVSFNAIGLDEVQGTPLIEMSYDDFARPVTLATRTQFLTAKAVAPYMIEAGSGVIMMITATPARVPFPLVGGFGVSCAALEGFSRTLAAELGPQGVRVICLRSAGSVESIQEVLDKHAAAAGMTRDEFIASLTDMTLLKRLPSLADVGNVAALMASDYAGAMTGAVPNVSCGQVVD